MNEIFLPRLGTLRDKILQDCIQVVPSSSFLKNQVELLLTLKLCSIYQEGDFILWEQISSLYFKKDQLCASKKVKYRNDC
jgi:hypothetical protein